MCLPHQTVISEGRGWVCFHPTLSPAPGTEGKAIDELALHISFSAVSAITGLGMEG